MIAQGGADPIANPEARSTMMAVVDPLPTQSWSRIQAIGNEDFGLVVMPKDLLTGHGVVVVSRLNGYLGIAVGEDSTLQRFGL